MNEDVHPTILEALRGHMPSFDTDQPANEADRVRADIEHQRYREKIRYEMALDLQIRQQAYPGACP